MYQIYTIGHSNHEMDTFIGLLKQHQITAVCDVRSAPYSKYTPQFNYDPLRTRLKTEGIEYVYLGKELGPRSEDHECYINEKVQYRLLAQTKSFKEGIARVKKGVKNYKLALMCAEKDPAVCHRTILVCRHLRREEYKISHILEDGTIEENRYTEQRLMKMLKIPEQTLFEKPDELIERAYDEQGDRIAYTKENEDQEKVDNEHI